MFLIQKVPIFSKAFLARSSCQRFFLYYFSPFPMNIYFCCNHLFENRNTWTTYESVIIKLWLTEKKKNKTHEYSYYRCKSILLNLDNVVQILPLSKCIQLCTAWYWCWSSVIAYNIYLLFKNVKCSLERVLIFCRMTDKERRKR